MLAAAKATKATQQCARMSVLLRSTGHPPLSIGTELVAGNDADARQHLAMPETAKLVAGHQQISGCAEHGVHLADIPGHHHRVDVGAADKDAVDHVRTGEPERHLLV